MIAAILTVVAVAVALYLLARASGSRPAAHRTEPLATEERCYEAA